MQFEIEVNSEKVWVTKGATILDALKVNGIRIPTLCHINDFFPTGACRLCMVEVEGKENLIPACSHPVEEWMKIQTHSPRVIKARRAIVELLLSNHPNDCLYCDRHQRCELQNLSEEMNITERRYSGSSTIKKKDIVDISLVRDPAKCVLCERCIKVCSEYIGVSAIAFIDRGENMMIGTIYNKGLNAASCVHCGQCLKICPTGAISDKSVMQKVHHALQSNDTHVVAILDDLIISTITEELHLTPSEENARLICEILEKIGFDSVEMLHHYNDEFVAQQAEVLYQKIKAGEPVLQPQLSSFCPAWTEYLKKQKGVTEFLKSPQQLAGVALKERLFAEKQDEIKQIYTVSVTPCTARKNEAYQQRLHAKEGAEIDAVLTTREIIKLISVFGIDIIQKQTRKSPTDIEKPTLLGRADDLLIVIYQQLYKKCHGSTIEAKEVVPLIKGGELVFLYKSRKYVLKQVVGLKKVIDGMQEYTSITDLLFLDVLVCPGTCLRGGGQPIEQTKTVI